MGSDNISTDNNAAAIKSGLGLDLSPSLSSDNNNSLSGSEGMNGDPQGCSPLESPTCILNVSFSFLFFFGSTQAVSFVVRYSSFWYILICR